ncbi:MAG: DUF1801 domain-containing protein [Planctomycetota bacterium]|nr:DUF1801 domain-containing protein [Planctomycetota bacterium]
MGKKRAKRETSSPRRLDEADLWMLLDEWPDELADLVLKLRALVLETAPQLSESIAFNALCYYKPDQPFGKIGGNVCLIGIRGDAVHLGFIHGASLPDPEELLRGTGKAKRHIPVRSEREIRPDAFAQLILAAIAHTPTE